MTAITLSNINKRFGEKVLFRDYSLHIEAGEFVAIKGESGAGKTTLLNIIGLLETPDSGSVTLCGAKNPSFSPALRFTCGGTSCPTCFGITGWWTPTPWKPT